MADDFSFSGPQQPQACSSTTGPAQSPGPDPGETKLKAQAELALSKGHTERAASLYRNLVLYERDVHGEDWPGQLSLLHVLSRLLLLQHEYAEAVAWLEKALVITVTFCGPGVETAAAMAALAAALRKSGAATSDEHQQARNNLNPNPSQPPPLPLTLTLTLTRRQRRSSSTRRPSRHFL